MSGNGESGHERLHATEWVALDGRAVHLGGENLVGTHAIADEVEDVFDFGKRVQSTEYRVQTDKEDFFHNYFGLFGLF